MTTVRRIVVSQINGEDANNNNTDEIRPFGETSFSLDTSGEGNRLTLMMFDGQRTHIKSKVLSPGMIYGSNADSGDGNSLDTIKLIPDATLFYQGSDQYVIVDPTIGEPGHIHIRAGGTQDSSSADLYLGGEQTFVRVSDTYDNVSIGTTGTNANSWVFGSDGTLLLPRDAAGNTDPYLWITGGPTPSISSVDVSLAGPANFQIVSDYLNLSGYTGAKVAIKADNGEIATDANMVLTTNGANPENTYSWTFGTDGVLTLPAGGDMYITGNITGANVVSANTFVSTAFNVVTAGNLSITSQYGLGFTGTILEDNGTLELIANGGGSMYVGWDSLYGNGLGNIATVSFNEVGGGEGNILLRTGNRSATEYNWVFGNDGSLSTPGNVTTNAISSSGNISASYFIGNGALLTGISAGSNYGNSNVTALMSSFGSNTIATTGNITAGNLIGNISITGNVTGTSSNVQLVAGAYTWTFNNTGNLVLPGNTFAVNYANGTAVTLDTVYLLEAYASETYTLPGSFTEDVCRYSYISNTVNVPSAWFNTSTYTFTPLKAGYWDITAAYDVYRNTEATMVIKKNTTIVASAGSFNAVAQQITKIIYLNGSTDYIQIFNTGGAALSRSQYESRSWFQARWIGE